MSARHVWIFKNGSNQAIRIPRELELSVDEATIYRDGSRLIIEPVERTSLLDLVATWSRSASHARPCAYYDVAC